MRISWFVALGLLSLLIGGAGCSASVTASTDVCSPDSTVACTGTDTGLSCTGSAVPDASDDCVAAADADTYCCSSGGGTIVITTGCTVDTTVTGCADPSTGYSCTGTVPPDQMDSTLECSIGVADATDATLLDYCCLTGITFTAGTCAQDDTVTCPTPGSFGFSCDGTDTPDMDDSTLTCTPGTADPTDFCCISGGGTSTTIVITTGCTVDTTVTGCADPSTGYSCTGTDPPDEADPTLECSIGVADATDATLLDYCCLTGVTFTAGTCSQDDTVGDCTTPGSFGFKCAGSDTPDSDDSSLTGCSTGVPDADGTSTDYCCTN
ncbi:MAG: hypothetical protein ACLP1X_01485 [Polyangiaceae bacterium]|jgi:hypothetical protein